MITQSKKSKFSFSHLSVSYTVYSGDPLVFGLSFYNILGTPLYIFVKLGTNIHLDSRMNWLHFGGKRPTIKVSLMTHFFLDITYYFDFGWTLIKAVWVVEPQQGDLTFNIILTSFSCWCRLFPGQLSLCGWCTCMCVCQHPSDAECTAELKQFYVSSERNTASYMTCCFPPFFLGKAG